MAEDWRLTVTLEESLGSGLLERVKEHSLGEEMRVAAGQKVAISGDSEHLFAYADTEDAARDAQRVLSSLLDQDGIAATYDLARWHPIEEEWEPANVPLPSTPEEIQREHERLEAEESAESAAAGYAEWEVRVDLPSHHDAVHFAERLADEGYEVTRRWKYLVIGAANEDDAAELAERLGGEIPTGAQLHVEGGGEAAWEGVGPNPFAVFGGLGT
jgi:hypothetical protein